jgi:hypothetical protein
MSLSEHARQLAEAEEEKRRAEYAALEERVRTRLYAHVDRWASLLGASISRVHRYSFSRYTTAGPTGRMWFCADGIEFYARSNPSGFRVTLYIPDVTGPNPDGIQLSGRSRNKAAELKPLRPIESLTDLGLALKAADELKNWMASQAGSAGPVWQSSDWFAPRR